MTDESSTVATVTLDFQSYWQCGTGEAAGDLDELVETDEESFPCVNGKRLKGVLREAFACLESWEEKRGKLTDLLFGTPGNQGEGVLHFSRCRLEARAQGGPANFFHSLRSTKMNAKEVAEYASLRHEQVCKPLKLTGTISLSGASEGLGGQDWVALLNRAASLVRELGKRKNRGRGKVCISITSQQASADESFSSKRVTAPQLSKAIARIRLTWTAQSSLVFSAHAATLGAHESLPYIPGSNIGGLLASSLYQTLGGELGSKVFSRGYVRFGDGHLLHDKERTRPVPRTWVCVGHKPRPVSSATGQTYCLGETSAGTGSDGIEILDLATGVLKDTEIGKRLYGLPVGECTANCLVHTAMGTSMHNALEQGLASSGRLFGYEFIKAGQKFAGDILVALDSQKEREKVVGAILNLLSVGRCFRIGRSHTAEYGEVCLDDFEIDLPLNEGATQGALPGVGTEVSILCESHLQVFDSQGAPTAWPLCSSWLGLPKGELVPERTSVAALNVAHRNGFYGRFEADRLLIQRGSVLTFKLSEEWSESRRTRLLLGVGEGLAQGYGEVSLLGVPPRGDERQVIHAQ